jgi:hypothetical protein
MPRSILIAVAGWLSLAGPLAAQRLDRVQAVLLHTGKDAFVHAVPLQPGYMITFTIPSTGVMKPLLKAEPQSPEGKPAAAGAHGTFGRRPLLPVELIAGAAADGERLYVVTATRVFQSLPAKGGGGGGGARGFSSLSPRAAGEATEMKLIGHQFKLHAFSLKDGTALMGEGYELPLVSEDPKATEPPDTTKVSETLGKGPIELVPGGLKCRGTTVIFSGNDVKSLEVKGKQFTPPPGFFNRDPDARTL